MCEDPDCVWGLCRYIELPDGSEFMDVLVASRCGERFAIWNCRRYDLPTPGPETNEEIVREVFRQRQLQLEGQSS